MRRSDQVPDAFKPVRRSPRLQWRVFDGDGVRIASLETPEGFEAYAVRGDAMWGVFTTDLEVESVRAYRLSRSP
jgi:hypothetical protein